MSAANDLNWCIRGAIAVGIVCAIVFFVGGPSIIAPVPLYLLLLAWTMSFVAVLVLPAIYFLSAYYGTRVQSYPTWVVVVTLLIAGLDAWYFTEAWAYGIKWQGAAHTQTMLILNILGLGAVSLVAAWGLLKNSMKAARIAHLCLFIVLAWCAFPVLGELP
jgi:hypothetical protein